MNRSWQDRQFVDATSVFIADVSELKRDGNQVFAAIAPTVALKGPLPTGIVRYEIDQVSISCGDWDFPNFGSPTVFYAGPGASIRGALHASRLRDPVLREQVLQSQYDVPFPRHRLQWFNNMWLLAGGGAMIFLLIGYGLGRAQRSGSKRPKVQ